MHLLQCMFVVVVVDNWETQILKRILRRFSKILITDTQVKISNHFTQLLTIFG